LLNKLVCIFSTCIFSTVVVRQPEDEGVLNKWVCIFSTVTPSFSGCLTTTAVVCLRVEFLLKTDGGYPRDAEVTLLTL